MSMGDQQFSDKRILIVDDSPADLGNISRCLKNMGVSETLQALTAEGAFDLCRKGLASNQLFDLIICDWFMPGGSGLDLLMRIRRNTYFSRIPFLMVTGAKEKEQVSAALKEGVDGYLLKPFSPEQFEKVVAEILAKPKATDPEPSGTSGDEASQ